MSNDERNQGRRPSADPDETRLVTRDSQSSNEETKILPSRLGGSAFAPPSSAQEGFKPEVHIPGQTGPQENQDVKPEKSSNDTVFIPSALIQREGDKGFDPVVGWIVIKKGPGRGNFNSLGYGVNSVGRGENQRVRLDYGDERISRSSHAQIIYDEKQRKFFLRDGGQSNIVRLNDQMILAPTELSDRDIIEVGETQLLFVALCNSQFDWHEADERD